MSISTEISRIQTARDTLKNKAIELKISAGTEKLDELAEDYNSIVNLGSISAQIKEGETYTIPKGYHDGTGTISGIAGGGNYSLQSKIVTPTKKPQQITPDEGYYGLSDISVQAIPSQYQDVSSVTANASDVLSNKIIVTQDGSVTPGTMPNNGSVNKILDTQNIDFTIPLGYHDGTGNIQIILEEEKTIIPEKSKQTITPQSGKLLSNIIVDAIPDQFIDTTSGTATSSDILFGKIAFVNSEQVIGAMPNNGDQTKTIDGISLTSVEIPSGYTTGGVISLTNDIENALAAI